MAWFNVLKYNSIMIMALYWHNRLRNLIRIMKLTINYIILCLGLLIIVPLNAQENWDLKKCITYAIENNLEHRIFQLDEETAKIDAFESWMYFLPGASASSSYGINYGRSTDPNTNDIINTEYFSNSYSVSASWTLFDGFSRINSVQYYNYQKQASYWNTLKSKDDLAFTVLMAYYDIVYYKGLVKIVEEQLELSAFNLKKVKAEVDIGTKSNTDLAEIQASYELEILNLVQSKNNLEEAEIVLAKALNLPIEEQMNISYDSSRFFIETSVYQQEDSLVLEYLKVAPELFSARADLDAAKKNIAIQRSGFSPSLYLGASMGTGFYETNTDSFGVVSFNEQFNNNMSHYVGFSISIPIFQRFSTIADVKRAKISYETARIEFENKKLELYYQLTNDIRKWYALETEFTQMTKQVEANKLAYRAAYRRYEEGLDGIIDMLTVKNRLANSQSQLLQTRLQWEIQYKLMEFYKGTRFWEI